MTGTGLPELAAAVSRAGGLGIVAIHNFGTTEEACRAGIRKTRELCEGKPFGVTLSSPSGVYDASAKVRMTTANTANTTEGIPPKGSGIGVLEPDKTLGLFNAFPKTSILSIQKNTLTFIPIILGI